MPVARFQMPDGRIARFEVPEGTTPEQAQAMIAANVQENQPKPDKTMAQEIGQGLGNLAAGAIRGAGSIGATLLAPVDIAKDALAGKGLSLASNRQRRADMDAGLQSLGAEPDSLLYKGGKLGGEIAGTAGAGGAAAQLLGKAGLASPALLEAIKTAGMSAPGAGLGTRALGGAITGGLSAGMVNPEDAATGAAVGGAFPVIAKGAGAVGEKIGGLVRGPAQSAELQQAIKAAQEAGYVIPPTQAKPSLGNRLLEGMAGKISTAQNASAANQEVTNKLAARALGLADDVTITPEVLDDLRKTAGKAYKELESLPKLPAQSANPLMNLPARGEIDPAKMVFDLRKARNDATAWFKSYNRTADPDALLKAQSAKSLASNLESTLEGYAKSLGRDDLVSEMAQARQLIAKTYTVENALNAASGTVSGKKLATDLAKGKPLSGELKQAAEFASMFPKAAQTIEGMGSLPQTSPLDWMAGAGLSAATANPLGLLSIAARPAARKAALSPLIQSGLLQSQAPGLLADPALLQLGYRAAPLLVADQ